MSVKFWLVVTVLSVALAHTYVYTDLLSQGTPPASATGRNDFPGYMAAMQFSMADIWKQLKAELKMHLEVGQRTAVKVRRNIAEFRKRRAELKAKRDVLSKYK